MAFDFLTRFVRTAKPQPQTTAANDRRQAPRLRAPAGSQVLVVDDSPTIRAVLGKMLGQDGYTVLKAPDGETAVTMARSELPDLIFLDIVLPGMSGFEVLRTLRRDPQTKATPIVMISGNMQATEQFYVQRFGADDFMKKPFGRAEVFGRISTLIESGRLPQRALETEPVVTTDISAEEWDAIPDVAMPDAQVGDVAVTSLGTDETTEQV